MPRSARPYAIWTLVIAVLVAVPLIVWTTRDHTGVHQDSLNPPPSPSPTASPSPAQNGSAVPSATASSLTSVPLCSNVWQEGKTVPADYDGCQNSGKLYKRVKAGPCIVAWDGRGWAKPNGPAHQVTGKLSLNSTYDAACA